MTIKHLVISGGGHTLFQSLGTLYYLETNDFFKLDNIESIYGTSAGTIIAVCIALKFDWETLNDYIIKRPWKDVFKINIQNILDVYKNRGIFDNTDIIKCFKPLFDAKDIPIDINLHDFYKLTKIELHFFTFEINEYKVEDISYLTHPNIELVSAVHMSCSIPVLFKPVFIEDKCYVDGGISCNYPLNYCIESGKLPDEIIGLKNNYYDSNFIINKECNVLQFLLNFIYKALFSNNTDNKQATIINEVLCNSHIVSLDKLKEALYNIQNRKDLFEIGLNAGVNFLLNKTSNSTKQTEAETNLENSVQELL
jgi:predicted acylesterase/phospholipase RssA